MTGRVRSCCGTAHDYFGECPPRQVTVGVFGQGSRRERRREILRQRRVDRLLDKHPMETCDCGDGYGYGCSHPPYCVAEEHEADPVWPDFPCPTLLAAAGLTMDQWWQRESDRMDAVYAQMERDVLL